jgi:hypothetical protein
LSKCHASILILAGKTFDVLVAVVALNATTKGVHWQMFHCLCENEFASVH